MFSKPILASIAFSVVKSADAVQDTSVISSWNYFKPATTDNGLTNIDAAMSALKLFKYDVSKTYESNYIGCGQCIMSGLEFIIERKSVAGD
jgi:hypothetical protein